MMRSPSRFDVLGRLFGREAGGTGGPIAWLIVGLGNPGPRYDGTRHNVGQRAVDALADRHGVHLETGRFKARFGRLRLGDNEAGLAVPTTFMNLSGDAVAPLARFYKVPPERIIVVFDDLDLPLGKLRLRHDGGAGGHNGMKSCIERLGTPGFPRLRIGVGRPPAGRDSADFVLSRFAPAEAAEVEHIVAAAADALEAVVQLGVERAMNQVNTP